MKQKFTILHSNCVPVPVENVDTDQIMPARFLKSTTREGFGENLFHDWRYDADGRPIPTCMFNDPRYAGAKIILAGRNFGCGSSREHAAWAIADAGFRVVISSFFADIHRNNELNNFVLPVTISENFLAELFATVDADPRAELIVDLESQSVTNPATGHFEHFDINSYKKECFLEGLDDIDYLLKKKDAIVAFENNRQ